MSHHHHKPHVFYHPHHQPSHHHAHDLHKPWSPPHHHNPKLQRNWQPYSTNNLKSANEVVQHAQKLNDGLYEDPEFQSTANSLGGQENGIVWKRPSELTIKPELFDKDGVTHTSDVIQGALGDCWFLGALAVVANRMDLIKEIVVAAHPEHGFYQFRFYKNGEWHIVTIDDRIPCKSSGDSTQPFRPVYAHCKDFTEFWVPLMEKAYAKINGSYHRLESGYPTEGFVDLTGGVGDIYQIKDLLQDKSGGLWGLISRCIQESWLMGASIVGGKEADNGQGLLSGHAYSVIDARQLPNSKTKLIKLRNPWGKKEWTGRWSDSSNSWTPQLLKFCGHTVDPNDGVFWMDSDDFSKYYTHFYVCKLYTDCIGDKYSRYLFKGEWKGSTAGGCSNHPTWSNNPQYGITITQSCNVVISLSQEDVRMLNPTRDEYAIGFQIFKTQDVSKRLARATITDQVLKSGSFQFEREVSIESVMQAGKYILVPSTFEPKKECSFVLTILSQKEITLTCLKPTGEVVVSHSSPMDSLSQSFNQLGVESPAPRDPRHVDPYHAANSHIHNGSGYSWKYQNRGNHQQQGNQHGSYQQQGQPFNTGVSQQNNTPHHTQSTPHHQQNNTPHTYGNPQQNYSNPQQYSAPNPQQGYNTNTPNHTYSTPHTYNNPQQGYNTNTPNHTHSTPHHQQDYGTPHHQTYNNTQHHTYGNPQQNYGNPQQNYSNPQQYSAPNPQQHTYNNHQQDYSNSHHNHNNPHHPTYGNPQHPSYTPAPHNAPYSQGAPGYGGSHQVQHNNQGYSGGYGVRY